MPVQPEDSTRTLIDALLEEQRNLTAVERFARWHDEHDDGERLAAHRALIPLSAPKPGEQYAFEVNLDKCSGCKSCVTACHALNGLDDGETWRSVGLLHGEKRNSFQQTITTACHHCVDPGCLNGCPVLAYDKNPLTGIVRHLDDQCIGCQYCVFMCPYEVPKYSEMRGIVRKCDMCHQRLDYGEAPACVQACPSEAIRITIVEKGNVNAEYRETSRTDNAANPFLPCSPEPAITLPTTRFVSANPLPAGLTAGDAHEVRLQPTHVPLVVMLVFTQFGAGGFALLPVMPQAVRPTLSSASLVALLIGLSGSVLHLGQPLKAWRAFLGLRRSWLSREIVVFGFFALVALATTICSYSRIHSSFLAWTTSLVGLVGVFCSGMTYHVTQRECWRGELSLGRFVGTTIVLGLAAAWCSAVFSGLVTFEWLAVALAVATVAKISRELALLRCCPDDADLDEEPPAKLKGRTAFLMRFRQGGLLRVRFACAWIGGIALPLISLICASTSVMGVAVLSLCVAGELIERVLFFRAAVVHKMPGSVSA